MDPMQLLFSHKLLLMPFIGPIFIITDLLLLPLTLLYDKVTDWWRLDSRNVCPCKIKINFYIIEMQMQECVTHLLYPYDRVKTFIQKVLEPAGPVVY